MNRNQVFDSSYEGRKELQEFRQVEIAWGVFKAAVKSYIGDTLPSRRTLTKLHYLSFFLREEFFKYMDLMERVQQLIHTAHGIQSIKNELEEKS